MKHRWANSALLVFVLGQVATGYLGLVAGSVDRAFLNDLHAAGAFGILVVLAWKLAITAHSPSSSALRTHY